jgi:hypothetical protein
MFGLSQQDWVSWMNAIFWISIGLICIIVLVGIVWYNDPDGIWYRRRRRKILKKQHKEWIETLHKKRQRNVN